MAGEGAVSVASYLNTRLIPYLRGRSESDRQESERSAWNRINGIHALRGTRY